MSKLKSIKRNGTFVETYQMAQILTDEALEKLRTDPDLFSKVSKSMGVTPDSLVTLIRKKSKSLNTVEGVLLIAEAMNKDWKQIVKKDGN